LSLLLVRFGQTVRELRRRKGVSQERLAELCGLHRTYVSSVERGERNISLLNIAKLAAALDVPLERMMPKERRRSS
jgi:transcriptional regulator with XRE-family HTH domain